MAKSKAAQQMVYQQPLFAGLDSQLNKTIAAFGAQVGNAGPFDAGAAVNAKVGGIPGGSFAQKAQNADVGAKKAVGFGKNQDRIPNFSLPDGFGGGGGNPGF